MDASTFERPRLLDRVSAASRRRAYGRRAEQALRHWIRQFVLFHDKRHPISLGEAEVHAFLQHLDERGLGLGVRRQARSALVFLYREVLGRELDHVALEPPAPQQPPLTRLSGTLWLLAALSNEGEIGLSDCLRLRVRDVDLLRRRLILRGPRDRALTLSPELLSPLQAHLERVRGLYLRDLAAGVAGPQQPLAPAQRREWGWQYLFPSRRLRTDGDGARCRAPLRVATVERALERGTAVNFQR